MKDTEEGKSRVGTAKAEKDRKNPHGISFMKPNAAKKLQGCKFGTIFVESVKQGSPACRAGIKAGDNIIRVNDWCGGKKSQSQPLHPEEDGAANTARLRPSCFVATLAQRSPNRR